MSNFILTGLFTEGTTDERFLKSVIERTLEDVAYECTGDIETGVEIIRIEKTGLDFVNQVLEASHSGIEKFGIILLFVHTDADDRSDKRALETKIRPVKEALLKVDSIAFCQHIVAVIPIHMTESWMIADRELLKTEIGIEGTNEELGINRNPEELVDPKSKIEEIIRISKENLPKRRRNKGLDISDLYQIIGQKIELSELEKLDSYNKFKQSIIEKLRQLNFYH